MNMNSWFTRTDSPAEPTTTLRVGEWTLETSPTRTIWTTSSPAPPILPVLTQEVTLLTRLRHPHIVQIIDPLKSTRNSLSFTTEPIQTTLQQLIHQLKQDPDLLDEVEIQKGLSQLLNALEFCHSSAKLVHRNLVPSAILITAKGDWKLSGFGLATYLFDKEGIPARWEYPELRRDQPASCQLDFDYLAPEVLLDEASPAVAQDLYSLGCLLHTIHLSHPPFSHRHSLENVRNNLDTDRSLDLLAASWRKLPQSVQTALASLLTRHSSSRLTSAGFLASSYFSSVLVSSLRYLERSSFSVQSLEAQISFLKGLVGVLPRFSEKVRRKKILPSLLEESRKSGLIPFILPNVMAIAKDMNFETFQTEVLTPLKPFFALKDPPAAIIALLDSVPIFIAKTTPLVFREEVMPLIYGSLDAENPVILEKALRVVPGLAETLDYTTVKGSLFPKITSVFSKTTSLSVKVNTLICFHSMIPILDKNTLTDKLVPLLAKIKTKEPSVTIATLAVHEEMGKKCEIEAIATLILPQLWTMSINPLLNQSQFKKFMLVITRLSARVEMEHTAVLEEIGRLEESTRVAIGSGGGGGEVREVDFESLVRNGAGIGVGGGGGTMGGGQDFWADDASFGGSGTNSPALRSITPSHSPALQPSSFSQTRTQHNPQSSFAPQPSRNPPTTSSKAASILGARPGAKLDSNLFAPPPSNSTLSFSPPVQPTSTLAQSFAPMQPSTKGKTGGSSYGGGGGNAIAKPNYNFNDSSSNRAQVPASTTMVPTTSAPIKWNVVPQLQPTQSIMKPLIKPTPPANRNGNSGNGTQGKSTFDWGDLDPLA